MAALSLTASFADLEKRVAILAAWSPTVADWSSTQDTAFDLAVEEGLRQVYSPVPVGNDRQGHQWSFLFPEAEITIYSPRTYGTRTVSCTSGVCTMTAESAGNDFESWMAGADLWITVGGELLQYEIASYDSPSQVTLVDTSVSFSATSGHEIRKRYYDLPEDYGGMESSGFSYRRDQEPYTNSIPIVPEQKLRRLDVENEVASAPAIAAIIPKAPTATESTRWQVQFFPYTSSTRKLIYRYKSIPVKASDGIYHAGGALLSDLVTASVVDAAARIINEDNSYREVFLQKLWAAVEQDKRRHSSRSLGKGKSSGGYGSRSFDSELRRHRADMSTANINLNI